MREGGHMPVVFTQAVSGKVTGFAKEYRLVRMLLPMMLEQARVKTIFRIA